ncbi:hypothetical protein OS493_000017 [Desmophyllum pertusum]|uniref:Glutamine amidotransferase type-2 domain-containing protein n=1 Tax=Desmophyllum pertusum TaxID=174260 RepID=A0A9X0DBV8_9CNID|nr:hypothetical protein OS493_000017 [Desmophyllum pertusum]
MVRSKHGYPPKQGLYSPDFETEACGVGFVAKINGEKSFQVCPRRLQCWSRMKHRGACGFEENCGDGSTHARENNLGFTLPLLVIMQTEFSLLNTDPNKKKVSHSSDRCLLQAHLTRKCSKKQVYLLRKWQQIGLAQKIGGFTSAAYPVIRLFTRNVKNQYNFKVSFLIYNLRITGPILALVMVDFPTNTFPSLGESSSEQVYIVYKLHLITFSSDF